MAKKVWEALRSAVAGEGVGNNDPLLQDHENWVKNVTCPRCRALTEPTEKSFAFGVFDGIQYYCQQCEKSFNAYYKNEKFSHTVPKADVKVYDAVMDGASESESVMSETEEEEVIEQGSIILEQEAGSLMPEEDVAFEQGVEISEGQEEEKERMNELTMTSVVETASQGLVDIRSMSGASSITDEVIGVMRRLREEVIHITDLSAEEGNIVEAFSASFLSLMSPLTNTLPVDISILPVEMGEIEKANIMPKGELALLYRDGRMDSIDLKNPENRDLLVEVVRDVMPRFGTFLTRMRERIERRITFFSEVTRELQSLEESARRVIR